MKWDEFLASAPQIGEFARDVFEDQHLAILGTNSRSGWPRISPCEVYFVEGELMLGMMRNSRKMHDLRRDSRITVVNGQTDREPERGDVKLYGRAAEVTDPRLRDLWGQTIHASIGWRPDEPFPLFSVDIERASYIAFGDKRRLLRWSAESGEESARHPGEDGSD